MTNRARLARRRVLWGLGAGMLAGLPFAALPWRGTAAARTETMLLALFNSRRPRAIGLAYARSLPRDEISPQRLARAIVARQGDDGLSFASMASLRASVGARIRRDFADGEVVSVDGWLLSVTEARLCAFAARAS
jgi:hypothetical protein